MVMNPTNNPPSPGQIHWGIKLHLDTAEIIAEDSYDRAHSAFRVEGKFRPLLVILQCSRPFRDGNAYFLISYATSKHPKDSIGDFKEVVHFPPVDKNVKEAFAMPPEEVPSNLINNFIRKMCQQEFRELKKKITQLGMKKQLFYKSDASVRRRDS